MEEISAFFNIDVPAWVVFVIAGTQAILSFWSRLHRFTLFVRDTNRRLTGLVRRWLGLHKTIALTQKEYDALPNKEENTLYLVKEE